MSPLHNIFNLKDFFPVPRIFSEKQAPLVRQSIAPAYDSRVSHRAQIGESPNQFSIGQFFLTYGCFIPPVPTYQCTILISFGGALERFRELALSLLMLNEIYIVKVSPTD
ncbi:hypothetical protein PoB_005012700 [Plakobranchus ocellatus]|uniref:Uncharacterized protein n=1 Tax=Plakobranchus ocellatus TaxID=259542 RepID=A0AAV4BWA2_9GAST|nr:hypothetical protein PoB_005012700 [Plakobranchus ocellatus]